MSERLTTQEALKALRNILTHSTRRHSRIHIDAADDDQNRLRALKGICGECTNLIIEGLRHDGKDRVHLRCVNMRSPLELYRSTELGEAPRCSGFNKKA